jgi:hypothetical protein
MHRTIFQEPWWLDVVAPGRWAEVQVERGGTIVAALPYVRGRSFGRSALVTPTLCRTLHPVVDVRALKTESANRARLALVGELIDSLPGAASARFVLGPEWPDALAWQSRGFHARPLYTSVLDVRPADEDPLHAVRDTTRRVVRRARESLRLVDLDGGAFTEIYAKHLNGYEPYFDLDLVPTLHAAAAARDQGRAIAAIDAAGLIHATLFTVWDKRALYYFLTSRDVGRAHVGAVAMLVVEALSEARRRGLAFDFDGITTPSRLQFIVNFGGDMVARTIVERGDVLHESLYGARRIWRRLREGYCSLAD